MKNTVHMKQKNNDDLIPVHVMTERLARVQAIRQSSNRDGKQTSQIAVAGTDRTDNIDDQSGSVVTVSEDKIEGLMMDETKIEEVKNVGTEVVEDRLPVATRRTRYKPKCYNLSLELRLYLDKDLRRSKGCYKW